MSTPAVLKLSIGWQESKTQKPNSTPLLTDASRRPSGQHGMLTAEVSDKSGVQDVAGRDPASLLGTVALPINEILEPTAPTANVHQPADSERFRAIDEARGRGWLGGRMHGVTQKGLDLRDVECGVNTA